MDREKYSALRAYESVEVAKEYEADRYANWLGRYRYAREQSAVSRIIENIELGASVIDCPSGTGRWWPTLATRVKEILAVDASEEMLRHSAERIVSLPVPIRILRGRAERLAIPSKSFDYVFSHALTKHLPVPIQYEVLAEFSRVARKGVICSFGIFGHLTYEFWRRRNLVESYPVSIEELKWMADAAGLAINALHKCTTPIGVEHTVFFLKKSYCASGAKRK